jgi:ribosomal protein S18 acetylase RimI-like enzyme
MVSALEELAAEWGYKAIILNPRDQRAILFWEAMGYRKRREYHAWYKSLSVSLDDLAPVNPTLGPPLPQGLRQFWPNQPPDP